MSALVPTTYRTKEANNLHVVFLSLLPRIEQHARISFRHIRCQDQKQDAVAETVAIAWKWFIDLTQRGKDARNFVSALATFAARAVKSGRRLCGQQKAKDIMSPRAQQRQGFVVQKLPDYSTLAANPILEALIDNTRTSVPDQVVFRCDFPVWLASLSNRDRRVVDCLAQGERTTDVAQQFGFSSARVSQLRREFQQGWQMFCGDTSSPEDRSHTQPT